MDTLKKNNMEGELIKYAAEESKDHQDSLDEKYPDRHTTMHKVCCKYCPSNNDKIKGIIDPVSSEIKNYPKEIIAKEFLFVCAWRPSKLCKGLCDYMEIDEEYLESLKLIK